MKNIDKNYKAVTLAELTVVMAIISVFAAMSWSSYSRARYHAEVEAACSDMASLINQTRTYALIGEKVSGSVPSSFNVSISTDTSYTTNPNFKTGKISNKVTLSSSISKTYNVPSGDGVSGTATFDITGNGFTKTLTVSPYRAVCN